MKEYPVLFTDEMVRAYLAGRKTQHRVPIKTVLPFAGPPMLDWLHPNTEPTKQSYGFWFNNDRAPCRSPFGGPGDLLWGRECFCIESNYNVDGYPPPFLDGRPVKWFEDQDAGQYWEQPHYRATDPTPELADPDGEECGPCVKWRPSTNMARWMSRITPPVKRVWVERVQEIGSNGIPWAWGCEFERWENSP